MAFFFLLTALFPTSSVCAKTTLWGLYFIFQEAIPSLSKIPKPLPGNRRSWSRVGKQVRERSLKTRKQNLSPAWEIADPGRSGGFCGDYITQGVVSHVATFLPQEPLVWEQVRTVRDSLWLVRLITE